MKIRMQNRLLDSVAARSAGGRRPDVRAALVGWWPALWTCGSAWSRGLSPWRWFVVLGVTWIAGCGWGPLAGPSTDNGLASSAVDEAAKSGEEATEMEAGYALAVAAANRHRTAEIAAEPTERPIAGADATPPPLAERKKYWLGIQSRPASRDLLDQFELECGLIVGHVVPGGPADGLLMVSDLIIQYDGQALGCEKKLCGCIGVSGTRPTRLTVIRKAARMEIMVQPQPIEWLENGSIIQYTIADGDEGAETGDRTANQVRIAGPDGKLVEKFRLFVAQPPLLVRDSQGGAIGESRPGTLNLERVASFRTAEDGSHVLVVQEGDRVIEYPESEWDSACQELKELCKLIDRQP